MTLETVAPVVWAFTGAFLLLWFATIAIFGLARLRAERDYTQLKLRVKTWWWILAVFAGTLFFQPVVGVVIFAFVSFLAFKEYLTLIPMRRADHAVLFLAYYSIPLHYLWIGLGWYGMFVIFIPIYMFLLLPMRMVLIGETEGFLRAAATIQWGLMTTVFSLSHMAYLLMLPAAENPAGSGDGLLFFLVFLTQLNDVAQYLWGKSFGKHKVTPKVSPNKTLEGLIGGVATTTLLAVLIAPYLTPFSTLYAAIAGVMIGLFGFAGDVSISAVKRDLGVKDSGTLLPGHGGILDRLDSLTYTAPLFFHFVYYLYY